MTSLEVVDSAVKIGLGAVLTGIFAWLSGRSSHHNELAKERLRRRQDAIERIAEQFETASHAYLAASSQAMLLVIGVGDVQKCIDAMDTDETAAALKTIDGRLRVFGLVDAAKEL